MKCLTKQSAGSFRTSLRYRTAAALAAMVLIVGCDSPDPTMLPPPPHPKLPDPESVDAMMNTPFIIPPVMDPVIYLAKEVEIPADERVVGVVVGETVRAYLISALKHMQSHVVIDTRGPRPLAVTFCDRSRCTRVLAGQSGTALQVQTAGFINGEMWLRVNGQMLPQSSTDIPLEDIESVVTTWQEWKASHPDTTVYLQRESEKAE